MNDVQEDKNTMYLTVEEHLSEHASDYSSHPKIAPALTQLSSLIVQISTADAGAIVDNTGVAEDKEQERLDLEKICFKVANALNSYGRNTGNRKLEKISKYTMTELEQMRDSDLNTTASLLKKTADPIIASLADDRLLPADLTQLETERLEFLDMLAKPRHAQIEKTVAGSEVDRLMDKTDALLTDIDGYVETYRFENTELWEEYFLARAIVDSGSGGGGGDDYAGNINPGQQLKVADITYNAATPVTIEVSGTSLNFGLANSGMLTGGWNGVSPGSEFVTTMGAIGPSGNELVVHNPSGTPGSYTVTIG